MDFLNLKLIGVNSQNLYKFALTLLLIGIVFAIRFVAGAILKWYLKAHPNARLRFWAWQLLSLASAALFVIGVLAVWFRNPQSLTTAVGLVTAGLAFALQRVITSFAAYFIILRGRNFTVGDRIILGGVRGDVIAIGFMQTSVMEMGQSPPEQPDAPAQWIKSRQYTGRIVTITNDKIFEQPVFNYTRDFPYIWEEITIPITFRENRRKAEEILLETTRAHTEEIEKPGEEALTKLHERYFLHKADLVPKVYYHITDNWLELTVRFITREHGTRDLKDAISRDLLAKFDEAGIGIASATYDIVGVPTLRVQRISENGASVE